MNGYVETVLGQVEVSRLGICQCHEHLLIEMGESYRVNPALFMDEPSKSAEDLLEYKRAGGGTLIDAQPPGCGRMILGLRQIAERTGVKIIASTGFHKRIFYPQNHRIFGMTEEEIASFFLEELTCGAEKTESKAGIIKTALDENGLDETAVRLFSAAAEAAKKTGKAMMIHIDPGSDPVELLTRLKEMGVNAGKLIFCHLDRACRDISVHEALAGQGCYLEYDTIAREKYHDDQTEAELIRHMVEQGYESRLLLSLDTTRERLKSYTPSGPGLSYLLRSFCGLLKKKGIGEDRLKEILIENPARVLAGNGN